MDLDFLMDLADKFRNRVAALNQEEHEVIEEFEKGLIQRIEDKGFVTIKDFQSVMSLVEILGMSEDYDTCLVLNKIFMDVENLDDGDE